MCNFRPFLLLSAGIALIFLACVQPVDLEGFVSGLPKPEIGVDIDYEAGDESPRLQWSSDGGALWRDLGSGEIVTVDFADPAGTVIIRVIDLSDYAGISWYCGSETALTPAQGVGANGERLNINPGTAPFTEAKIYQMAVVRAKDGIRYGTSVSIKVVGNSP